MRKKSAFRDFEGAQKYTRYKTVLSRRSGGIDIYIFIYSAQDLPFRVIWLLLLTTVSCMQLNATVPHVLCTKKEFSNTSPRRESNT